MAAKSTAGEKLTWDVGDLAEVIKKSRPVVHRILKTDPDLLPPPARRIGRVYLWLPDEVMAWLRGEERPSSPAVVCPPAKRGRGRPRKDAQQSAGGAA